VGLDYYLSPRREVVLAGDSGEFLRHIRARFLPHTITLRADAAFFPGAANMQMLDGEPTAYVCQDYTCQLPTCDLAKLDELLQ